jgi:uncharacterized protein (TIGR03437 family)
MKALVKAVVNSLFISSSLFALVPGVTSVQNPASNIVPGLPNYGIAQGSIFIIYGSGMGPSTISIASTLPYQNVLSGTSVAVTSGGLTQAANIVYTLSSQVAAIMPSSIPTGNATIKVTYNGFVSQGFSTTIVQNNFGISTLNQTGFGPAVITYPTSSAPFYGVVSTTNSAVPGNTYTMWGTGLGPAIGGNSDNNVNAFASVGPQPTILIGGIAANIVYYGRSPGAGPGLDQINFTIPSGVTGCNVSMVVQTTGTPATLSNSTTIPIAANGGACSDTYGIQASTWSPLLAMANGINVSFLEMIQTSTTTYTKGTANPTTVATQINADFVHYTQAQLSSQYQNIFVPGASSGSCVTTIALVGNPTTPTTNYTGLDAGLTVNLNSFTGQVFPLQKSATGIYGLAGSTTFPTGTYTLSVGAGGTGVTSVTGEALTLPSFATWTNQAALGGSTITRANGLTITWAGGGTGTGRYIDIQGSAGFGGNGTNTITFDCVVPPGPGTFTIPSQVLLAMPVGAGSIQVNDNVPLLVTAPSFNLAVTTAISGSNVSVNWN